LADKDFMMDDMAMPATDAAKVLADYTAVPVSGEAMVGLFGHEKCTWSVRFPFPLTMAHGVALALEHNLVGCRMPGGRR
jgi:hypothetical protein